MSKNFRLIAFLVISFLLAVIFRLYNYPERLNLENDNSRDVQVAIYAADYNLLPQIGQYTSSGPFFYGPFWYWILTAVSKIPLGNLTPWYVITLFSFVYLYFLYVTGSLLAGKWVGAVMLFIGSISAAQIDNFLASWNPVIIPFLSLLAILFLVRCVRSNKALDFFVLAFIVGIAITIHLQSILLLPVLLISFIFAKNKIRPMLMIPGFILPFLPLIYFDFNHNWQNSRNFYQYLTVGQYNIYVPNRWLTYAFDYWPKIWGRIIGVSVPLAIIIICLLVFSVLLLNLKLFKQKKLLVVISAFILEVILLRYYRGERFVYLSLFAFPYVTFFTAFVIVFLFKKAKFLGLILFLAVSFFSLQNTLGQFGTKGVSYKRLMVTKERLYSLNPAVKFNVFACEFTEGSLIAHPMAYFIYRDGREDENGLKIGFCMLQVPDYYNWKVLSDKDINTAKKKWINKSTKEIHRSTVAWWQ